MPRPDTRASDIIDEVMHYLRGKCGLALSIDSIPNLTKERIDTELHAIVRHHLTLDREDGPNRRPSSLIRAGG
jgi:hypothetical protein